MLPARPRQIEFSRLNMTGTVMSKRYLRQLVEGGHVAGWDDPRMPTLSAMRRRGYPAMAIRNFVDTIGMSKADSTVDYAVLEHCVRDVLGDTALRAMAVLRPLKVVLTNWPEGETKTVTLENHPDHPELGTRELTFGRELYIEREDFMEEAPKKYFRLTLRREVRLRYAYFVTAQSVEKDADGNITCIHCTYDPATRGGDAPDGRKVKGTLHWVSAQHAIEAEVRLFDRLFATEAPDEAPEGKTFLDNLNPDSLRVVNAKCEPSLADARMDTDDKGIPQPARFQFERMGYFCTDYDSLPDRLVFNRICTLKDSWAKIK